MTSPTRWLRIASVTLAIGAGAAGAGLLARGGPSADALHEVDEPKQQPPAPQKADTKAEFQRRYLLAPGQDLKRIGPPFDESRIEYYNTLFRSRRTQFAAGDLKVLIFKQRQDGLGYPAATIGGGERYGTSLSSLLTHLAGLYPQDLEGKKDLLETFVEGDFVAREGVSMERLIGLLEKILRDECKLPLKLNLRAVERTVVVARGRYKFRPVEPGRKQIEIYGQTLSMTGPVAAGLAISRRCSAGSAASRSRTVGSSAKWKMPPKAR
jgi:hypothetical protein